MNNFSFFPPLSKKTLTGCFFFCTLFLSLIQAQTLQVCPLAGNPSFSSLLDSTGTAARFNSPNSLALDASGNIYVGEDNNHAIRKVTPTGVVTTIAGNGTAGSADGIGRAAQFNRIYGIALDRTAGILYVSDYGNHLIRKVVLATGQVTTLAGSTQGFADGIGTAAKFSGPTGLALDATATNLYVADGFNYRIRKIALATSTVTTVAGSTQGFADGTGAAAKFWGMSGIRFDANATNLYVADAFNHRIRKVVIATGAVSTLAGNGTAGNVDGTGTAAQFNEPRGIGIDGAGNLYVAERIGNRIRKVTPEGVVTNLAGTGTAGTNNGTAATAQFNFPFDVAVNASGNLFYVAEERGHRIRKIALEATATENMTWTGSVSTDWNTPCNWSPYGVPTATNRLTIPNVANKPVILTGTTATCLSIGIAAASSLTINNGGTLTVLPTDDRGTAIFINSKGTLTNNGTLSCTATLFIDMIALPDSTTFNNNGTATFSTTATDILLGGPNTRLNNSATGIINIQNGSGIRTLTGAARIGTVITNQGTINYSGSVIGIQLNPNYTFNNSGTIHITRGTGLYNEGGILNNLACGKIFISNTTDGLVNSVAGGLVTNAGLIVTHNFTNTNGTFNNTSVTNRLPTVGIVTNTGNGAVSVRHNTYPIFAYGGTFNGTINGIFTDSLATVSAGTFTAPFNFTPLATLPRGVQTLYVKITPSGGACTYIVPFSYNTLTSSVLKIDDQTVDLHQNRPNPFSQQTTISFDLTETNKAVLTVFDITGRQVFASNQDFKIGYNEVILDKSILQTTGTYFYRLTTDKSATVKKLQFVAE